MKVLWPYLDTLCWDQGVVAALLSGTLWPRSERYDRERPDKPEWLHEPYADGAVLVLHGAVTARDGMGPVIQRLVAALPWCVVIQTSDEDLTYDASVLAGPRVRVWKQMVRPGVACDRPLLLGWRAETRAALLSAGSRICLGERPLLWSFAGQAQNDYRRACLSAVSGREDGDVLVTSGFGQGRPLAEHLAVMAQSRIVLCPSGNTVDCQRPYEALEAGCLPIADRRGPSWPDGDGGYWRYVLGREPFPCVDSWSELPALLDRYAADHHVLQRDANRAGAWWLGYKRHLADVLAQDVAAVGGKSQPRGPVTVLMPTSVIPGCPSTDGIEDAIRQTRAYPEIADAEIIIMVDGLHARHADRLPQYEEYKRRLIALCSWDPAFAGCLPLVFDEHSHQAEMTRQALRLVRTPLVFFQEHDTYPRWGIDWTGLFRSFDDRRVNMITLHTDDHVLDEHRYLMLDPEPQEVRGVPLLRHQKWSQRPHLARADWYRQVIADNFGPGARTMIEDVMWGMVHTRISNGIDPWEKWGLWMYHPTDEKYGILRSGTTDGRGADEKLPMIFDYPGDTPAGAPPRS